MTSLSTRLLIVVLLALLPVLGFQAYTEAQARHVREQLMQDEALHLLHLVRSEQQRIIDGAEQVLNLIAGSSEVQDGTPERCERLLANLLKDSPRYDFASVETPDGTSVCAPGPPGSILSAADRAFFRLAQQTLGVSVGEYTISRSSGEPTINVAEPIRNRDGAVAGVADLALSLKWLDQQLTALDLPRSATAIVADRNGTVLAHYPSDTSAIGEHILPESDRLLVGNEIQVTSMTGPDKRARLMAYSPPGATRPGLWVGVALDPEVSFATVTQASRTGLVLIVAGALLAILLTAAVAARLIRRPVNRLLDVAGRWRSGDLTARTGMRRDGSEFGRLAGAFEDMAQALQSREQALHAALESTTDFVIVVDNDWRVTYLNARAMARASGSNPVGQLFWDAYPATVGTPFDQGYRTAKQTGVAQRVEAYDPGQNGYFEANVFPTVGGLTLFIRDLTEERRNAAALRESEALFRAAFEQASVGMVLASQDGIALRANDKLCAMLGYTSAEILDQTSEHLTHPEDRQADRLHLERAFAGELHPPLIKRYIRKDGTIVWVNVIRSPLRDAGGPGRLFAVMEDITERRHIETALRNSEERLRLAMDGARLGVKELDLVTNQGRWTSETARILGCDLEGDTSVEAWAARVHPDDWARVQAQWDRAVSSPEYHYEAEYRFRQSDDTWRWIAAYGRVIFDAGRAVRGIVVVQDISARKRVEEALRESETRLRMSQEAGRIGTWEWDLQTNAVHWSDMQCRQFGINPADGASVTYETWRRAVHPDDLAVAESLLHAVRTDGSHSEVDYRIIVAGKVRWMNGRGYVVRDADGKALRMVGIDLDITERRELENRLRGLTADLEARVREEVAAREAAQARAALAERMQALGQLAGGIAHDMNNVLQAVSGALRLIQRRADDQAAIRRFTELGIEAIERGASITNRLLTFGRRGALRAEPLDMAALLQGVHEILTYTLGAGIEVAVRLPEDLPPVIADKGQLETALINLATNARDAMPQGGRLTFTAERQHFSAELPPHPAGPKSGRYLRLEVSDTGIGMDAATLARAREPFFTTKTSGAGTGLGLPMVHGFAEQSGGAMTIESLPGQGTTVTFWLPEARDEPVTSTQSQQAVSALDAPARVLLVDDEAMIREVLGNYLEDAGYAVLRAHDGAAALDLLANGAAVEVLITDLSMPGMDGLAVIRAVQARHPNVPAILLTGYAEDTATLALSDTVHGAVSLLRKPVTDVQLLDRLGAILATQTVAATDGS